MKRAPKSRFTILDPIYDGAPVPTKEILNLGEIKIANIGNYIGKGDGSPEEAMKTLKFLAKYSLIANEQTCLDCGGSKMALVKDSKITDRWVWRCNVCRKAQPGAEVSQRLTVRSGSFFEDDRIPLHTLLKLMVHWAEKPTDPRSAVLQAYDIHAETYAHYYSLMRDITDTWFTRKANSTHVGGPGSYVEIDETLINKPKYHRGRMVKREQIWVFGGIERSTNRMFMEQVPARNATILLPIIQKHVEPGSTVVSDGWKAYGGIKNLSQQFKHKWVNHKISFVDPIDPQTHTQSVEATWGALKRSLKHLYGMPESHIKGYLSQYMYRRYYNRSQIFGHILIEISKVFQP